MNLVIGLFVLSIYYCFTYLLPISRWKIPKENNWYFDLETRGYATGV